MTDKEIYLYKSLMRKIENKNFGNADEADIQRALGALFQAYKETEQWENEL